MNSLDSGLEDGQPVNAILTHEASRIVVELLGRKVESVEMIHQGLMTFKFLVEVEGGLRVIVRFYPSRRKLVVNQEPDLLARCRLAKIPVSQIIGDSRTDPSAKLAYIVYYMIDGMPLLEHLAVCNSEKKISLASDIAQQIFNLRAIEFEGCGELETGCNAFDSTWEMFVENSIRNGIHAIHKYSLLGKMETAEMQRIVNRGFPGQGQKIHSLIWGDINFENIIVDSNSRFKGFIDFESCLSGDPLATLGYCFAAHGTETFFTSLLNAWPEPLGDKGRELVLFYAILRALRLACYAHLPLPTGYLRDPLTKIFPGMILALEELSDSF